MKIVLDIDRSARAIPAFTFKRGRGCRLMNLTRFYPIATAYATCATCVSLVGSKMIANTFAAIIPLRRISVGDSRIRARLLSFFFSLSLSLSQIPRLTRSALSSCRRVVTSRTNFLINSLGITGLPLPQSPSFRTIRNLFELFERFGGGFDIRDYDTSALTKSPAM